MNREKRDKIPSMQVSFIDAICTQLYEVFLLSLHLCAWMVQVSEFGQRSLDF